MDSNIIWEHGDKLRFSKLALRVLFPRHVAAAKKRFYFHGWNPDNNEFADVRVFSTGAQKFYHKDFLTRTR